MPMMRNLARGRRPRPIVGPVVEVGRIVCVAAMLARTAAAIDGVVLINQQSALSGGTIAGDMPGFPITIATPGSYRLSSNLDVRGETNAANLIAIQVTGSDVTIDLNGFAIIGPVVCSGSPPAGAVTCAPTGSGRGISTDTASGSRNVVVRNGSIIGMSDYGIHLLSGGAVEGVRFSHNRNALIVGASIVSECAMWLNGEGLRALGSVIADNTAFQNEEGFRQSLFSVVAGNTSRGNHVSGFGQITTSSLRHNSASTNGGDGFDATGPASIFVGNASMANGGSGFAIASTSVVIGNAARDNTDFALRGQAEGVIYGGNVLTTSNGVNETQVSGCVPIESNLCGSNTTCP